MEHKGRAVANSKTSCRYCEKITNVGNIKQHEKNCFLNPANLTECIVCTTPIKNYKSSKGTCSRSCANTHFRSGTSNGNWKGTQYQTICFTYHDKKCIICGEDKIVAVHHYDHNHDNNDPANLIPMCPTHHSYVHSKYADEVMPTVDEYVNNFIRGLA